MSPPLMNRALSGSQRENTRNFQFERSFEVLTCWGYGFGETTAGGVLYTEFD